MSHNQAVCTFFNNPGGCRKGSTCRFLHTGEEGPPRRGLIVRGRGGSSRGGNAGRDGQQGAPPLGRGRGGSPSNNRGSPPSDLITTINVPYGVCRPYFTTGVCRRGFNCNFRHEKNPALRSPLDEEQDAVPSTTGGSTRRLLDAGTVLSKMLSSSSSDALFPLELQYTYNEAHDRLRKFFHDTFRFTRSMEVVLFLRLISTANSVHGNWEHDDRQLLLQALASRTGNGLRLFGSILGWESVSTITSGSEVSILPFQTGYLPLLAYLSSHCITQSTLQQDVNALYALVDENFDHIMEVVRPALISMLQDGSFRDPRGTVGRQAATGTQVFHTMCIILLEYVTRFKRAAIEHSGLVPFVEELLDSFNMWRAMPNPLFAAIGDADISPSSRETVIGHLLKGFNRLQVILGREKIIHRLESAAPIAERHIHNDGLLNGLHITYEGPGMQREGGPRHDNDHIDINDIKIAPTHGELVSSITPYLPVNLPGAPHPYPSNSMQRLLDIHFRLLREELIAPLRASVRLLLDDLNNPKLGNTILGKLLAKNGGFYKGNLDRESVMFPIYTNINFSSVALDRRGVGAVLTFDSPPNQARRASPAERAAYWERSSKKRLMQGALVALIWHSDAGSAKIYLGTVSSSSEYIANSARKSQYRVAIQVSFFDPEVELRILEEIKNGGARQSKATRLLTESSVMFESIRPFLESLRVEPTTLPFDRYLAHPDSGTLSSVETKPPMYTVLPGFEFELKSLFYPDSGVVSLKLSTVDPDSIQVVRQALKAPHPTNESLRASKLDPSQSDAIVDALTREVSLIQGPPGTGKSYTGVELLRVLVENQVRPILMIAFTNHALDHMLRSVLDAEITKKVVRLGSRSADPKISSLSLEELEKLQERSRLSPAMGKEYSILKDTETEMENLMKKISQRHIRWDEIKSFINSEMEYLDHHYQLSNPPRWIEQLYGQLRDEDEEWTEVQSKPTHKIESIYDYWLAGKDLEFLEPPKVIVTTSVEAPQARLVSATNRFDALQAAPSDDQDSLSASDEEDSDSDDDLLDDPTLDWIFLQPELEASTDASGSSTPMSLPTAIPTMEDLGAEEPVEEPAASSPLSHRDQHLLRHGVWPVPAIPTTIRSLEELQEDGDVWGFSKVERQRISESWSEQARMQAYRIQQNDFERLRRRHLDAQRRYNELKDESRTHILRKADLVACTTSGAAKFMALVKALGPVVTVVEEAGQVLEAHILSSLVPSIKHLILIGDPLQLRPTISNYSLSLDNPGSGRNYRLDQSLMERLANLGLPMSMLNVQRRMRPSISSLIRNTLYLNLEDHALVQNYPLVRGIGRNIFFMDHRHREQGGDEDSVSKHNKFEALMIKDLVLHLLRQGTYSGEGDIVVLCAYLGQLSEIRKQLAKEVTTVLDERDLAAMADAEEAAAQEDRVQNGQTPTVGVEHVKVSQRVLLRTVDNFQGEEAKIIILSLVRNSGNLDENGIPLLVNRERGSIGFLKSPNRTNVALSRAKEGLIIFGDSQLLSSKSPMWAKVLEELESTGCLGPALPIVCRQHPEYIEYVDAPEQIRRVAPDGGCLRPCLGQLQCGHACTFKCHSDDPQHRAIKCVQPCARLCPMGHPCNRECAQDCGACEFPVYRVSLPCGHTKEKTTCSLSSHPELIKCEVIVTKKLPSCEHEYSMMCGDDSAALPCRRLCDKVLACCKRKCSSLCHDCQSLNGVSEASVDTVVIDRVNHAKHPCGKDLRCGHSCGDDCVADHSCSGRCKGRCRQKCAHLSCSKACSEACPPCLQPCAWKCKHYVCALPCGSICARLPCDERCVEILACGHQCPSVCGEDCSVQICPTCASPDDQDKIVDFIMSTTMAEVDLEAGDLSNTLITLACRHTFTVESLDGICMLGDYYERKDEKWVGVKDAPERITKHPSCPTCRADITSLRYGRVVKRAKLDLLEHNLASGLASALSAVRRTIDSLDRVTAEEDIKRWAGSHQEPIKGTPQPPGKQMKALKTKLNHHTCVPTSLQALEELARVSPPDNWRKVVRPLINAYTKATEITKRRSAHRVAYEAAFADLYHKELGDSTNNRPRLPEQHAMRMARINMAQPKPIADERYHVEAMWTSIEIRFTLADLATLWLASLPDQKSPTTESRRRWNMFVLFIYKSVLHDASEALETAKKTSSHRQIAQCSILVARAEFELFRFNHHNSDATAREHFKAEVDKKIAEFQTKMDDARRDYMTAVPPYADWFDDVQGRVVESLREAWNGLRRAIYGTFYSEVSLEEKAAVIAAFRSSAEYGFNVRGHFYQCPNGHTYAIGECGGAMQEARCMECGVLVGGRNHTLTANNRRDAEMEELLGRQGAAPNPWPWAR